MKLLYKLTNKCMYQLGGGLSVPSDPNKRLIPPKSKNTLKSPYSSPTTNTTPPVASTTTTPVVSAKKVIKVDNDYYEVEDKATPKTMELTKGGASFKSLYNNTNYDDLVDRDPERLRQKPTPPKDNYLPGFGNVTTYGNAKGAQNIPNYKPNPNGEYMTLLPNMLNGKEQPTVKSIPHIWSRSSYADNTKLPAALELGNFRNKDIVSITDAEEPATRSIIPTKRVANVAEIPSIKFEGFNTDRLNSRVKRTDFTNYTPDNRKDMSTNIQKSINNNIPLSAEQKIYYYSNNNNEFDPSLITDVRERELLKQEAIRRGINIKADSGYHTYSSNNRKKEKVKSYSYNDNWL